MWGCDSQRHMSRWDRTPLAFLNELLQGYARSLRITDMIGIV